LDGELTLHSIIPHLAPRQSLGFVIHVVRIINKTVVCGNSLGKYCISIFLILTSSTKPFLSSEVL